VLIIWDRLFGSFTEEGEKCVYGTRSPLNSWDPLWSNAQVYWALAQDSWHARNRADKLRVWFKPPGWRPADVAARFSKPAFDLARIERYHPPVSRMVAWFGAIQFLALLHGVALFLWHADTLPLPHAVVWVAALSAGLWAVGAVLQGRLTILEVLLVEAAALATATAAANLIQWHLVFKPLVMLLAIFYVADPLHLRRTPTRFDALLMAALACSLAGDCFLMFPGFFIPGLASFLVAHLFYIALFKRGLPWFPNRRAPFMTLALGAAIYAFLYQGLNPVLKIAVAAYVVVIALMAAQAIGRAAVLRDKASVAVAVGAVFFMLSDSFLAVNKFAFPLPMAQFGVLATYYVAQLLIACNAVPVIAGLTRNPGFLGEARGVAAMDPGSGLPRT
jgi:alkylglycerol monooxygenase